MALVPRTVTTLNYGHKIVTQPANEPVELPDLKEQLRRTTDNFEDSYLGSTLLRARQYLENRFGLAFINQSWKMTLDQWPVSRSNSYEDGYHEIAISEALNSGGLNAIELPRAPLSSITSITTYDQSDTSTSHTVATYFIVDTSRYKGRIILRSGQTYPTALREANAVEIEYVAGFGTAASDVPPVLRAAVLNTAAYMCAHRGDDCTVEDAAIKSGADSLCGEFRDRRL